MAVTIVRKGMPQYPAPFYELRAGRFYEAANGTLVFVGRGSINLGKPLNVLNGMGGYDSSMFFRPIDLTITIDN